MPDTKNLSSEASGDQNNTDLLFSTVAFVTFYANY